MELLSPAGHWEAMAAAVQNGADAVYLGLGSCNARRGAKNFTDEEFPDAVRYCHLRGVKVYVTVNTLLTDRELPAAERLLRLASASGADGAIVQDWGLTALARSIVPDLPLHGSTQMTVHSLSGVERAASLGMDCVVLSRELSKEDIAYICRRSPIKIEVFAHGALCMCYSGQCSMSALIGGRSGNRGLCAQPCRLPYRVDDGKQGYPLSLKDANLSGHLQELEDMGVSILKLEGRMKRPEYVAVITRIYAALLRENRPPTPEELDQLSQAFSREGFTEGYWEGRLGPHMFGTRPENAPNPEELFRSAKAAYSREDLRTVPVIISAKITASHLSEVTVSGPGGLTAHVTGPVPEPARNRPLEPEEVKSRLSKTGGTVFRPERVELTLGENLSLPASAVNALRRDALERLTDFSVRVPERREFAVPDLPENGFQPSKLQFTVSLTAAGQLTEYLANHASIIYLPIERIEDFPQLQGPAEYCALLPRICKDSEERELLRLLSAAKEKGCVSLAVQNLAQLGMGEKVRLPLRGGYGLNVFNSRTLYELESWGFKSAALSFELRYEQIRDLKKPLPCEAIVYGRLPLMITENCLISNAQKGCSAESLKGSCRYSHILTDRRGEAFPILPAFGCRSEIENSRILYLADKPEYRRSGLQYALLRFTTETPEECSSILEQYEKSSTNKPENFTRGLFYRGVE